MKSGGKNFTWVGVALALAAPSALGAGATRDLPVSYVPGDTFTVTIALDPPPGTSVVAVEDAPPSGWLVSNISNSGTYDAQSGKVKWGLFFAPSIPASVSFDVLTSGGANPCFDGDASYDGANFPITGQPCAVGIPVASTWGLVCLTLAILVVGCVKLSRPLRVQS